MLNDIIYEYVKELLYKYYQTSDDNFDVDIIDDFIQQSNMLRDSELQTEFLNWVSDSDIILNKIKLIVSNIDEFIETQNKK